MISKRIDRDPTIPDDIKKVSWYFAAAPGQKHSVPDEERPDSIEDLSQYMAKDPQGEKLDKFWIVNCPGFTELKDLKDALINIEAVRSQKPDLKSKTYHLLVSFHPGEEEFLTEADLKDIEENYAKALGFSEHQRVVATHKNTQNYHMHVAYNIIHPQTYERHFPGNDYYIRSRIDRAMEKKYGLIVDRGITDRKQARQNSKARDYEAKTWQQSFDSYVREQETGIRDAFSAAKGWQEFHDGLADYGIGIKKRGAGLAFYSLDDAKKTAKASTLGRRYSLKHLEDTFGPFEESKKRQGKEVDHHPRKSSYKAKPLFRHPGQDRLWRTFMGQHKKPPGFFKRNFLNIKSWKFYLMSEAFKDPMAMVTIIFYRELMHLLEEQFAAPYRLPTDMKPALHNWFNKQDWLPSGEMPLERPGHLNGVGLRIDDDDRILFPMRDDKGVVWSVRAMDERGQTCDIGKTNTKSGLHHVLDRKKLLSGRDGPYEGPVVLAVDCATATSLHKHTSVPVIIAAQEEELPQLAQDLHTKHAASPVLVMASPDNEHAEHAAEAVNGRHMDAETIMALAPDLADRVALATPSKLDTERRLLDKKASYKGTIIITSLRDTAAEIHKATGIPALAVQCDKDLPQAAKDLRARFKDNDIIIMADEDVIPAQKAAKAVNGKLVPGAQVVLESAKLKAKGKEQAAEAKKDLSR